VDIHRLFAVFLARSLSWCAEEPEWYFLFLWEHFCSHLYHENAVLGRVDHSQPCTLPVSVFYDTPTAPHKAEGLTDDSVSNPKTKIASKVWLQSFWFAPVKIFARNISCPKQEAISSEPVNDIGTDMDISPSALFLVCWLLSSYAKCQINRLDFPFLAFTNNAFPNSTYFRLTLPPCMYCPPAVQASVACFSISLSSVLAWTLGYCDSYPQLKLLLLGTQVWNSLWTFVAQCSVGTGLNTCPWPFARQLYTGPDSILGFKFFPSNSLWQFLSLPLFFPKTYFSGVTHVYCIYVFLKENKLRKNCLT